MRITVMCAAGASSTFVAARLRRSIAEAHLPHSAQALPLSSFPGLLAETDVLLLGPHMGGHLERLRRDAGAQSVPVVTLPDDIFTDRDGARALALATAATPPTRADERSQ